MSARPVLVRQESIEVEVRSGIGRIWLNRPAAFNTLDDSAIVELHRALEALDTNPGVRVVVLGGRGEHFCAGADLHWMRRAAQADATENLKDARRYTAMLRRLASMTRPTVARVHGAAIGSGTGLAAACDMVVASDNATFGMAEVRLGMIPAAIAPYVVRAIGPRQALRYVQTGERISAIRAQTLGLVSEVAPPHQLDAVLHDLVGALLAGAPQAIGAARTLLQSLGVDAPTAAVAESSAQWMAEQRASEAAREGLSAFFEKRPPRWAGVDPARA